MLTHEPLSREPSQMRIYKFLERRSRDSETPLVTAENIARHGHLLVQLVRRKLAEIGHGRRDVTMAMREALRSALMLDEWTKREES